jgi:hypothetical protein
MSKPQHYTVPTALPLSDPSKGKCNNRFEEAIIDRTEANCAAF